MLFAFGDLFNAQRHAETAPHARFDASSGFRKADHHASGKMDACHVNTSAAAGIDCMAPSLDTAIDEARQAYARASSTSNPRSIEAM